MSAEGEAVTLDYPSAMSWESDALYRAATSITADDPRSDQGINRIQRGPSIDWSGLRTRVETSVIDDADPIGLDYEQAEPATVPWFALDATA